MISYYQDYVTIGAVLGFGLFLVVLLLGVASVLRPNKPYAEKLQTYECGVDPVGTGWSQTYVRYYIFGLLFVIFDVEAVFIFPWAINLEMFVFIFILLIGLIYAIRKDVLKWES
jgi:NADH-quinone oxidoreductase subunit A